MKCLPLTALLTLFALLLSACQTHEHVVLVTVPEGVVASPAQAVSESTRAAATALIAGFTDDQKKLALHDIKAPLRKDWHFVPRDRQGLKLGDMTNEQKSLVHKLMQTALSDSGYLKATDIIWLESVLYEMSNQNPVRDPGKYVLQIFGDPADENAAWGWRLEGHHLSLNLTYTPEGIGVTPLFFGTNPAVVQQGPLAGKRVLADAHNLAVELAKSMNGEQRKKMMLAEKPRDVILGPGRERIRAGDLGGVSGRDMNAAQRLLFRQLIKSCLETYHKDHNAGFFIYHSPISPDDELEDLFTFAWAGPIDVDKPFYYRIGGWMVAEYSCQGKNHVHSLIHNRADPLQEDLLKKHFEQHEH